MSYDAHTQVERNEHQVKGRGVGMGSEAHQSDSCFAGMSVRRRLEQVLHVHPEKYQSESRSNRASRHATPETNERSRSIDNVLPTIMDLDEANGNLLVNEDSTRTGSPQRGTPIDERVYLDIPAVSLEIRKNARNTTCKIPRSTFSTGIDLLLSLSYTSTRVEEELNGQKLCQLMFFLGKCDFSSSIVSFCWETVPSADVREYNVTLIISSEAPEKEEGRNFANPFFWIELVCILWFTIELFLRFVSSPSKVTFLTSFLNIIDFVAIAPFFVNLIWADASKSNSSMSFAVLRVLRLVRVFRIFKLSSYGDLVPLSPQGKIVGSMCALIGVLTLALPVPIIVANFKHFYRQENRLATMRTIGKGSDDVESGEDDS
uniref:Ion_trans domain-containing protein n=1 Tax=Heterorhabditis bacteriophora TaxID=37862 RepID=A0A1I7X9H3_HETBA